MPLPLQTVAETPEFQKRAARLLNEVERNDLISYVARNPWAGDVIPGSGGVRKVRWAREGRGKSGGVRTVTFYTGADLPLFLITIYGKGAVANLSRGDVAAMRKLTTILKASYWEADMNKVGESILQGLEEAIAFARGEDVGTVVRRIAVVPADVDVKRIREARGLSQAGFAAAYGFTIDSIRNWEQGRRRPDVAARVLLTVIAREPEAVERALAG